MALRSPGVLSRSQNAHIIPEYLAPPAYGHFTAPAGTRTPLADGSIDKPAEMTRIEFPGRTVLTSLRRALQYIPAGLDTLRLSLMQYEQKKHLPLDMHGDLPPSLLEALDRFERRSQEVRQLFLGLSEPLAGKLEFLSVHRNLFLIQ